MKPSQLLIIPILFLFLSCGSDDSDDCTAEGVSARIVLNDETINFSNQGYGLDLLSDGHHRLQLYYASNDASTGDSYHLTLTMIFRETGANSIDHLLFSNYESGAEIDVDFVTGDFTSIIISNNPNCFEATFSGSVTYQGNLLTISDGHAEYLYDEPLHDYTIGRTSD